MTISMGFRAPSRRSMVVAFCDYVSKSVIQEEDVYSDPNLILEPFPGILYILFFYLL